MLQKIKTLIKKELQNTFLCLQSRKSPEYDEIDLNIIKMVLKRSMIH